MNTQVSSLKFPELSGATRGRWAPVFLSPILGSPERFVIAVAVADDVAFHIERANEMRRLSCLYGKAAETALFAAEVAVEELEAALSNRGKAALVEGALVFSGVALGAVSEGEARSLQHLGRTWMSALSSLYRFNPEPIEVAAEEHHDGSSVDRLPTLVLEHVSGVNPSLAGHFSEEIRMNRKRRSSSAIAGVSIDFNGSHIVANFATLHSSATAISVDRIKRKMFDLKVRRDKEHSLFEARDHEMILFTPAGNSPLVNEKQLERVNEAVSNLKEQSDNEGFGFVALHDVPDIGERILTAESRVQGSA
ncbi:hypothetical protein [Neoaquamicrobium sediminum]|uniref:hypothetical protein n=1 Tax=Neoaquamicrobium sediminum TaxID=1849104 RepID=UPI003BABEF44